MKVTGKQIVDMLKSGVQPVVRFVAPFQHDSYAEQGMLARITKFDKLDHEMVNLYFFFDEFRANNEPLESHDWYGPDRVANKTAREVGWLTDGIEDCYIMLEGEVEFEVIDGTSLLNEYLESKSTLSYIQWLEAEVLAARQK